MERTQAGGAARFSCPPNFTATPPASEAPRFSLEALTGPDTELWLIQAPADFAPDCFNGRLVPLSGLQVVKGKVAGKRRRYQVLSSSGPRNAEATLLAPSAGAGGRLTCAPAPQGSLRIIEGPQQSLSGTPLQPIPASPPPQIPPGLRPRFCAFGGSLPITGPGWASALKSPSSGKRKKKRHVPQATGTQGVVNGHGGLEVDAALGAPEVDARKKMEQQLKGSEVTGPAATEPAAEMSEPQWELLPSTKRRKKSKGAGIAEPEVGAPEPERNTGEPEPVVKAEPQEETETVLSPSKRRKRPRQGEEAEPVEGVTVVSQPVVKVEPQEEAIPLPPLKKRKREKGPVETLELGTEAPEPEHPGRRKKEKWQDAMMEPGKEVVGPELLGALEPQAAFVSAKKKERGQKVTEPGTEVTEPPRERVEAESEATAAPGSTKKRKKRDRENRVPETAPQEEMPGPPLNLESGEVVPAERREKKRKRQLQQGPV
ncbi:DNA-directed RNA polymerase I subunit RPA34 [Tupaia chinensis]|uniref:DNA-directed RNA polymerase I subunit RPA34 n=1 Tax=Tupaia chinensis TaxID=246437 RepID=L9LBJ3_TUPCH|nr:DNA-directed RNA polymerase I subunit RPA34 [Tupaia chinensis]